MKKYVIYIRVSTDAQGVSHLGLDAQKRACETYVKQQKGVIIAIFEEVQSGTDKRSRRPIIMQAIEVVKQTPAILLVAKLDRLGRSQTFLSTVRDMGIQIESCDHGQMGTMIFGIYATLAQVEAELISKRTKAALEQAKKHGVKLGNPNGWRSVAKSDVNRNEALKHHAVVLRIISDSKKKGETYQMIADKLSTYGMVTQTGIPYTKEKLANIYCKYKDVLV